MLFFASLIGASTRSLPPNRESMMPDSVELRKRAEWYREFAERAGNPWVWEARLKTAKQLEAEAVRVEPKPTLEQERDDPSLPTSCGPAKRPESVLGRIVQSVFSAASRRTMSTERSRKEGPWRCAKNGLIGI